MDNIIFISKANPMLTSIRTVPEAQALMRKVYNDDSVDLAIMNILAGDTVALTINNVTILAKLA